MRKAILLARVSTEDQKKSLPAQTHRLIQYAERNGFDYVVREFSESAYRGQRSVFREILDEVAELSDTVLLVFDKIDRYTRDYLTEEVRMLELMRRNGEVELHFPSDQLIITKDSPANVKFQLGLGMLNSAYYSDSLSDNVIRGNQQKWRDGFFTSKAPFGYRNITKPDGSKWIIVEEREALAVKDAFTRYATGLTSLKGVHEHLQDEYGYQLGTTQIDKILKNPFYHGVMRIKENLYPHNYERVIDKSLFDEVERVRDGHKVIPKRWGGLPYQYRGLISCADCGRRVTFEKKKQKYIYGHCTQYDGNHGAKYVNEDAMTAQLAKMIKSIEIPEEAFIQVSKALKAALKEDQKDKLRLARKIDGEIQKYQNRIDKAYDDYVDGVIAEAFYKKKTAEYEENKQKLENQKNAFELIEDDYYGSVIHLLEISKNATKLFEKANLEQRRKLLKTVLSNLELDGKQLRWELKKPFDKMAFCAETANWLGWRDSNPRSRDQNPLPYHLATSHRRILVGVLQ